MHYTILKNIYIIPTSSNVTWHFFEHFEMDWYEAGIFLNCFERWSTLIPELLQPINRNAGKKVLSSYYLFCKIANS